jgi:hypothetical protein
MLVSYLVYSSTLKMEATCSSEILVEFNGIHSVVSQKMELFSIVVSDCAFLPTNEYMTLKGFSQNVDIEHFQGCEIGSFYIVVIMYCQFDNNMS